MIQQGIDVIYAGHDDSFVGVFVRPLGGRIRPGKAGGMQLLHRFRCGRPLPRFLQQAVDGAARRMGNVVETLQLFGQTVLFRG